MITALGAEALYRAEMIAKQAEIIAALTIEVLKGVPEQFAEGTIIRHTPVPKHWIDIMHCMHVTTLSLFSLTDVHKSRPHPGQGLSAERLRKLLYNKDGSVSSLIG